jgi:hypothetical protein
MKPIIVRHTISHTLTGPDESETVCYGDELCEHAHKGCSVGISVLNTIQLECTCKNQVMGNMNLVGNPCPWFKPREFEEYTSRW